MPASATITAYYSFAPLTKIKSAEVNANFALFRGHIIPIDPTATSSPDISYDLGADGHSWRAVHQQYGYFVANSTVTSNPPSGFVAVYAKSDNKVYRRTSAGSEGELAVSPLTSKGDIFTHDGSVTARLPVGSNGHVLTADSGTTTGMKWAANVATFTPTIVSTSGGMTVSNTQDYAIFTGSSASTFTLYACSTGTKPIGIKNNGSADLTVSRAGSDTIDGETSWALLPTQSFILLPDGATKFCIF